MKKGTVLRLKGARFFEFIAKNNILVIIISVLVVGIITGIFCVNKVSFITLFAKGYLGNFAIIRQSSHFLKIFFNSFMSLMFLMLVVFGFGSSIVGVAVVPITAFLKGVSYGAISAYLYSTYSVKGVAFNAVLIIPAAIVFIIAFLLALREAIQFSVHLAKLTFPKTPSTNLHRDFKNYCGRFLFISLIVLVSSIIDGLISSGLYSAFAINF